MPSANPRHPAQFLPPSGTAATILRRLRHGPATVADLVDHTGLSPNGVRLQLGALERERWVRRAGVRHAGAAGKPAIVYELDPAAEARFSAAYLPLLLALVRVLRDRATPADRQEVYHLVGAELARSLPRPRPGEDFAARVEAAAVVLEGLGGMVQAELDGGRATLRGTGCPVGEAVAVDPCVCRATAELVSLVAGATVVDRCEREGAPRCRFEIASEPAA